MKKNLLKIFAVLLLASGLNYAYFVHFDYRFEEVSVNKVYKSGLIDPEHISYYLEKYEIKTVINLLYPAIRTKLNPAGTEDIDAEALAVRKHNQNTNASVKHINIQSLQVPTEENLNKFYEVMDKQENYPVLIHCYHGTGRAELYSAIYRIEYESFDNDTAREKTRLFVELPGYRSSFSDGREKGDFLKNYKPREERKPS